jgi:hypothetical protein
MPRAPHLRLALLAGLLGVASCDCENKLKQLIDGRSAPRTPIAAPDQGAAPPPASSDPAEVEPNDTLAQSTPISVTSELRPVRGALATSADVDWYTLTGPNEPGPWLVELVAAPTSPGLVVALELDGGGQPPVMLQYPSAERGGSSTAPLVALGERGPLRVGVRAVSGQGDYLLKLTRRLSAGALEAEPDDTPETAWPLQLPGELQGSLDRAQDRDVFALKARAGQLYTLRLDAKLASEATLELGAGGQASTWATILAPGQPVEVPNLSLPPGEALLTLAGGDASSPQSYRLSLLELPAAPEGTTQEAEPNDDATRAQAIAGAAKLVGWLHQAQDVDAFSLTLSAPTTPAPLAAPGVKPQPAHLVHITATPTRPTLALGMSWRTETGTPEILNASAGQPVTVCRAPLADGTYGLSIRALVRPDGPSQLAPDYTLVIEDAQPTPGVGEVEPNDAAAQADALPLGAPQEGYISTPQDRDSWALVVVEDALAPIQRVRVALAEHPLNLAFTLFDDEGAPVGVADQAGPRGAESLEVDLPAGRYTVEVRSAGGNACVPYKLSAEIVRPAAP